MNRENLIEAMARDYCAARNNGKDVFGSLSRENKDDYRAFVADRLAVIEAAIPGLSDLLEGKAVVVPREPTDAMFFDPDDACVNFGQSAWMAFTKIYAAMIAASPYGSQHE